MKKVKVLMTCVVILLAVGGAFASKSRAYFAYTSFWDSYPGQFVECQLRASCSGSGALCRITVNNVNYQLYYSGCVVSATGYFIQ